VLIEGDADYVSIGSAATAENIVESDADALSATAVTDVPAEKKNDDHFENNHVDSFSDDDSPLKSYRKSSENSDADELCFEKDGSTDVNPPLKSYSKSSENSDADELCFDENGSTDVNPAERYMSCVTYDTATTYGRSSIVFVLQVSPLW
jgi:hypothetical protein